MGGNHREPMTDEEIAELREKMEAQREEIREYLDEQGVDSKAWETGSHAPEGRVDDTE